MNPNLDDALASLVQAPPDRDLSQVEPAVWLRIAQSRRERALDGRSAPYRFAAVLLALGLGTAVGAAHAREDSRHATEVSAFRVTAELAPSTLLDDHS